MTNDIKEQTIFRGVVTGIKPLGKSHLGDVSFVDSKTKKSLGIPKATLVDLNLIENDNDFGDQIKLIFYKNLDEKYIGRVVNVILKESKEKNHIEQKIESAEHSDIATAPYDLASLIYDCYFGS